MYSPQMRHPIAAPMGFKMKIVTQENRQPASGPYTRAKYVYAPPLKGIAVPSSAYDTTLSLVLGWGGTSAAIGDAARHDPDEQTHAHTPRIPVHEGDHAEYPRPDRSGDNQS